MGELSAVTAAWERRSAALAAFASPAGSRSTRSVRMRNPMPLSSIAMPITIAKVATLSAKYAVLSAVVSAVEVTQMLRAGLATGAPLLGSTAAAFSSLVPLPALSR